MGKTFMVFRLFLLFIILSTSYLTVLAQDFDIQRYDVAVQLKPSANTAQIQAKLALKNVTTQGRSGQFVTLRVNKRAKVQSIQVDSTEATIKQKDDERLPELSTISIDFPKAVPPSGSASITINYSLEVKESTAITSIAPGDTVLLPDSFWVPIVHTPYLPYGPDYAPFSLTVNSSENEKVFSDGNRRSSESFDQTQLCQPLLIAGNFEEPFEVKGSTTFEFVIPKGIPATAKGQAEALAAEANKILDFYKQFLAISPPEKIRVIASSRVGSYASGTTLLLSEDFFRRDALDLETIEFLARSLLRTKIGGELLPRGRGWNVLQDALPAYFAGIYFEKVYGEMAGREFFARRARAYAPLAASRNDEPLVFISTLDNQYTTSMFNKGPLMFRIIEIRLGRDKLLATIKQLFNNPNKQIRYEDLKKLFITADKTLDSFFDQWFDKISEPDFIIGVPAQTESGWKCALRNLGTGDTLVPVLAVTEKGEKLNELVLLPSQGRAEVLFKTSNKINSVEVDPDKFYPQTNYDNDTRPQLSSTFTLFRDANVHFNKKEFSEAETKLKEALAKEPANAVLRTLYVRTLAGNNRLPEAKKEIEEIKKLGPLPLYSITWLNFTLGEASLSTGQSDSVDYFRRAVSASKDVIIARQKLIEAERATSKLSTGDDSVKNFIGQLDRAIKEGTYPALEQVVIRPNLNKFVRGIVANKPENWSTQILRVENLTADRVSVDVLINVVGIDKREQQGNGLMVLRRSQNGWLLADLQLFNIQ